MPETTATTTSAPTVSPPTVLIAATIITSVVVLFLHSHPLVQSIDTSIEEQLSRAVAELMPNRVLPIRLSGSDTLLAQLISSQAFATLAALIGYKLQGVAKPISFLQLFVLSVILIAMLPIGISYPSELWLSILAGMTVGIWAQSKERALTQQQQLAYELKLRNQQLEQSELLLVKTDETDKRIFAADLHDRVLNDIKLALKEFSEYKRSPDDTKAQKITNLLNETMKDMRSLMDELNPVMLECFGLPAAIEDCAETFTKRGGIKVVVENSADASVVSQLSQVEQQLIYRLVQESLTNAYKHSSAALVTVGLRNDGNSLIIKVEDNGKGMSPVSADQASRGLKYMKMRAALIGAAVNWMQPDTGTGTVVQIQLPIKSGNSDK